MISQGSVPSGINGTVKVSPDTAACGGTYCAPEPSQIGSANTPFVLVRRMATFTDGFDDGTQRTLSPERLSNSGSSIVIS